MTERGYVMPRTPSGLRYEDYLRIFLAVQSRDIQLARMMDLIQINMQGSHDAGFLLREYRSGIDYTVSADGAEYRYVQTY